VGKIVVSRNYRISCVDTLGMTEAEAIAAVRSPDRRSVIRLDRGRGLEPVKILSMRRIDGLGRGCRVVTVCQEEGGESIVVFAVRVYPDLVEDMDEETPLGLVQAVASRFGMPITINGKTGTFFLAERVPASLGTQTRIFDVANPGNRRFILTHTEDTILAPDPVVQVTFAFCLDARDYRGYLDLHRVVRKKKRPRR
jgi:hypothetical protein